MYLETKYLGKMDIAADKIILFESGIPGFLEEKEFVLLDIPGQEIMQMLQSLHTPDVAFFITNPHHFYTDYTFTLDNSIVEALHIEKKEEIAILSIMTVREPIQASTINLKAPIIINNRTKLGKQLILNDGPYSMKATIALPEQEGSD